jgi:hypothetical protein
MKTLRLLRNIAVLFILVMAFLASRPGVGLLRAATTIKGCVGAFKSGFTCSVNTSTGVCTETKCADPKNCADNRCAKLGPGF